MVSYKQQTPDGQRGLDEQLTAWAANRTAAFASDLVGAALVVSQPDVAREAAEYLLSHPDETSEAALKLARAVLGAQEATLGSEVAGTVGIMDVASVRDEIHRLRYRLRDDPRNALLWVDLARNYAVLGLAKHAGRAMERGLSLTPDHRFTLRSAARLHLHLNDPERALAVLRRSDATERDPWLLAADLATATVAGQGTTLRTSRLIKTGRNLVESARLDPAHTAELASALGTLDIQRGDRRDARKMFTHALIAPTENAVAQAKWAALRLPAFDVDARHLETPRSFEARAWECFRAGEWDQTIVECWKWLADEPFSRRPAELGTFTALVPTEHFDDAIRMARVALVANPDDPLLLNNLAVGLASLNKAAEAQREFGRINPGAMSEPGYVTAFLATQGLIAFRLGNLELGRLQYQLAVGTASGVDRAVERALALAFWAREELNVHSPTAGEPLAQARVEMEGTSTQAVRTFLGRLEIRRAVQAAGRD